MPLEDEHQHQITELEQKLQGVVEEKITFEKQMINFLMPALRLQFLSQSASCRTSKIPRICKFEAKYLASDGKIGLHY